MQITVDVNIKNRCRTVIVDAQDLSPQELMAGVPSSPTFRYQGNDPEKEPEWVTVSLAGFAEFA